MIVVGLTGLATVGKSAVADILVRDYGFEKRSFAGPLKAMLRTLDPVLGTSYRYTGEDGHSSVSMGDWHYSDLVNEGLSEADLKEIYPEYRRLLQVLGTDCIRALDDDFWINAAKKTLTDEHGKYVFDDCRFPNEAEMIYDLNAYDEHKYHQDIADVWQVTRPGVELAPDAHISERHAGHMGELVEIRNNGSLELLKETVDVAMNFFAAPRRWMTGVDASQWSAGDAEWMNRNDE